MIKLTRAAPQATKVSSLQLSDKVALLWHTFLLTLKFPFSIHQVHIGRKSLQLRPNSCSGNRLTRCSFFTPLHSSPSHRNWSHRPINIRATGNRSSCQGLSEALSSVRATCRSGWRIMMDRVLLAFSVGVGDSCQRSTNTNHSMPPACNSPRQASSMLLHGCTRLPSRTWIRFPIIYPVSSQEVVFVMKL